ncbi:hypothetical protein BDZ91DRAFT_849601 [Kalaharituber pfeilii]|nr:hypothetical protein BDZ91DRAFT_849601 [Kalaharituber pfeilii]
MSQQQPLQNQAAPADGNDSGQGTNADTAMGSSIPHKRSAEALNTGIGGDSIAELIRKAKASRNGEKAESSGSKSETAAKKDTDTEMESSLEDALTCPICAELVWRPVAALTCLHTFCGSCLIPWLRNSHSCPVCRRRITSVKDDHRTTSLLDAYLLIYPSKSRTAEQLTQLDKIYKPGQKVVIQDDEDPIEHDHDYDGSDYGDDGEPDEPELPLFAVREPRMMPCRCCNPPDPNPYNYRCPHPIGAVLDGQSYQDYLVAEQEHRKCRYCLGSIPTAMEEVLCESCGAVWCGTVFVCPVYEVLRRVDVLVLREHQIDCATPFGIGPRFNRVEYDIFEGWRRLNGLSRVDIFNRMKEWLLNHANIAPLTITNRPFTRDTLLCSYCMEVIIKNNFIDWWIYERERVAFQDNRAKCWYGKNCWTQRTNPRHAEKLNHSCQPTPQYSRRAVGQAAQAPAAQAPAAQAPAAQAPEAQAPEAQAPAAQAPEAQAPAAQMPAAVQAAAPVPAQNPALDSS